MDDQRTQRDLARVTLSLSHEAHFKGLFCSAMQDATSNWGFDMLKLDLVTNGHSLSCFSYWLLQVTLLRSFSSSADRLAAQVNQPFAQATCLRD